MKTKDKILLVDGNNLAHRAYHQFKSMRSSDGKPSGVVFGVPYILWSLVRNHKPDRVYVFFDGGRDKNRLAILPNYKKKEPKADFDYTSFVEQKSVVIKALEYLGVPHVSKKDLEADDLMGIYCRIYGKRNQVMIVSTDKDFVQLINKNVSLWNPWKNARITHKNWHKFYKFSPEQCVDYLCLDGDVSDNIPGYKGVGEKTALDFLTTYGSIENYLNKLELPEHRKIKRDTLAELYKVNRLLIDIMYFCKTTKLKYRNIPLTQTNKISPKELNLLVSDYEVNFFSKPDFLKTFKTLLK